MSEVMFCELAPYRTSVEVGCTGSCKIVNDTCLWGTMPTPDVTGSMPAGLGYDKESVADRVSFVGTKPNIRPVESSTTSGSSVSEVCMPEDSVGTDARSAVNISSFEWSFWWRSKVSLYGSLGQAIPANTKRA